MNTLGRKVLDGSLAQYKFVKLVLKGSFPKKGKVLWKC